MKVSLTNSIIPTGKSLLIFDSDCSLCNQLVCLLLRLERGNKFIITTREHPSIASLIRRNASLANSDSVIIITNNIAYTEADAVKEIAKKLTLWIFPFVFVILITPRPIIQFIYLFVARNRRFIIRKNRCNIILRKKYSNKIYSS